MSLHSNIPRKTEWQKPDESNQKVITSLLILRQWVEQRLAIQQQQQQQQQMLLKIRNITN